jgi:hypothetical protein
MSRLLFILANAAVRARAVAAIISAPDRSRVEIKGEQRSGDQNARMWAMLTDIQAQRPTHAGFPVSTEDYKLLFLNALTREQPRWLPDLDGTGMVAMSGRSSSDLSKAEFGDLFEIMEAFAAREGIVFSAPERRAA